MNYLKDTGCINKNKISAPKWLPCMNACMCGYFTVYVYVHGIQTNVCVPLYSAKGY